MQQLAGRRPVQPPNPGQADIDISRSGRYVRASELKSFAFCHRAWFLERQGQESSLGKEQARGLTDHVVHVRAVENATLSRQASTFLLALSMAGIAVGLALWWLSR